jgi:cytoskeletal protein CcmA (bactofilin family)
MTPSSPDAAVLDPHAQIAGRWSGRDLVVRGGFEGEMHLTGRLRAEGGSRVRATVRADVVELEGEFEGEVRAATLVLGATARARGVFLAERLCVREGAWLEGSVNLADSAPPAEAREDTFDDDGGPANDSLAYGPPAPPA